MYRTVALRASFTKFTVHCHFFSKRGNFFGKTTIRLLSQQVTPVLQSVPGGVKQGLQFVICQHAVPVFWTIQRTLTHGDVPYNSTCRAVTPSFPADWMMVTDQQFEFMFLGSEGTCDNIGRTCIDLAVWTLPDDLLNKYCDDHENGESHESGTVAEKFAGYYSVEHLEGTNLWGRLAGKASSYGYCTTWTIKKFKDFLSGP